jgi:phosphatidylglycerophosphate synthase
MSPRDDLALKGEAIEEWIDLRFFRPVAIHIARALRPTRVSPDQVTMWSLWVGLLAAHLFVYESPWVNAAGFVLVVVADLLDSADGQLARMRGTASRAGRIMDGYADNLRWIAVYVHIALRLLLHGDGWYVVLLAAFAGACHSLHSATVDFVHGAYLEIAIGKGRVDLPEDLDPPRQTGLWWKLALLSYGGFTRQQARLFPSTVTLLRRSRASELEPDVRARFAAAQRGPLAAVPWLGQNAHITVLGAAAICGRPSLFLWCGAAMTAIALGVVLVHERNTRRVAGP